MLEIRRARLDDPDAITMSDEVQRYYVELYGGADEDPVEPDDFAPPRGVFLIGYDDGSPVAMGGWTHRPGTPSDVKLRRMYVRPEGRRRGYAAAVLDALEVEARSAGATRLILETGEPQVAAVRFYRARGYIDVESFGYYADAPESVHLGKVLRPER